MQANGTATKPTTDVWCLNCAQMVAPKREAPAMAWVLGAMLFFSTFILLSWHWALAIVTASMVTVVITLVEMRSICPICKSKNISAQAPTA